MNYKITEQYSRGEEKIIAEFAVLHDARFFITKKSSMDDEERKKIIYRIYDDYDLLHELNNANISTGYSKYAEGNGDLNNTVPFIFQVRIGTADSLERTEIAQFHLKKDASLCISGKFELDNTVHSNAIFLIYKGQVLIDTVNKAIIEKRKSGGIEGNEAGARATLSPLSTRPTPGGGPADYWVEKNDEDNA
jgi:hypothetical protein